MDEVLPRRAVHDQFGGSRQGGISPAARTGNILLFTSEEGRRYGYDLDGPRDDGSFHYTGEGQVGDQLMTRGNKAILHHVDRGLHLRMFEATPRRSYVKYLGEFALDETFPYYRCDARDRNNETRSVLIFRLWAVDADDSSVSRPKPRTEVRVKDIPLEAHLVEVLRRNPVEGPTEAERREAALVERYEAWLKERGHTARRQRIEVPEIAWPMYTDIYVETTGELIEAKGSVARAHVRTGLGQILDYERYVEHQSQALLLPTKPSADLVELLVRHDVACIWANETGGFERVDPPTAR
jgi:hypothetical protein